MTKLSLLDLCPVKEGGSATETFAESVALARCAERLGYHRYWLAEHHNMPGIASAATSILIGHVAAATRSIRVGAGGIMLPNHSPLVIAEQFGTLATLYPGRIDLGVGRAPGTDQRTMLALRRHLGTGVDSFPAEVQELIAYLGDPDPERAVHAVPGTGTHVPVWILGSSLFGAELAAALGLPYAFASHFAPDDLIAALALYRRRFQPSAQLDRPHVMLGLNVFAADTDAEAQLLFTSLEQAFVNLRSGRPGRLPPPLPGYRGSLPPQYQALLGHILRYALVGGPDRVTAGLARFIADHAPDEVMVTAQIFDPAARRKSHVILARLHTGG
jgi:luciferase family oxidoreductase group 1